MFPAFAIRTSPTATTPTHATRLGPDGPRQPVDAEASGPESQGKQGKQARRQPERTARDVEHRERAAVRVEGVEGPDERIVGEEGRVLTVEEQGEPVRLVAVAAVITAQGQVETEDQEIEEPARRRGRVIQASRQCAATPGDRQPQFFFSSF